MRQIRGWFFLADLWFSRKLLPGDPDIENNQIASQKSKKKNISMHYYQFLRCYFFSLTFEKKIDPSIFQRGYISIKILILVNSRHSFKAKLYSIVVQDVWGMIQLPTPFMSWQWQSWSIDFRTFPFFYEMVKITLLLSMYFLSIELTLVSITGHLKAR